NLLAALEELDCWVPFVFSSTAAVYGDSSQPLIPEETPLAPINPYGHSKVLVEQMLNEVSRLKGLPVCSLRYFNVAGADPECEIGEDHSPETHLIPRILFSLTDPNQKFFVFGDDYPTADGTCIRDYVHVWDLALAHIKALE